MSAWSTTFRLHQQQNCFPSRKAEKTLAKRQMWCRFHLLPLTSVFWRSPFYMFAAPTAPAPAHFLYKSWQAGSLHVDQSSELLIFLFSQKPDGPGGKQLVINPMGMFTVSSGMPMNPQWSIKGIGFYRTAEGNALALGFYTFVFEGRM